MAISVLAVASGVTTLNDHRLTLGGLVFPNGKLNGLSGIFPTIDGGVLAANLDPISAMQAAIAPFNAYIDGTSSPTQGGYLFCSTSNVTITFDPGEASVTRIDRVIARVYDNVYDGLGLTEGAVEYLKGGSDGNASAVPPSSILLWEVAVPAGASSGNGGINFATAATDKRPQTAAAGGILPIWGNTIRDSLSPHNGMAVFHRETSAGYIEIYNNGSWQPFYPVETGTWTPSSSWSLSGTWSGTYTKMGNLVFATAKIVLTGAASGWPTNDLFNVGNLPFSSTEPYGGSCYMSWGTMPNPAWADGTNIRCSTYHKTGSLPGSGQSIFAGVTYLTS